MSVPLDRCEAALKTLVTSDGVESALVVRRDGVPAVAAGNAVDQEVLGAMAAAAAGALDVCLQTIGGSGAAAIDVRSDGVCMAIAALDDEYILVAIAPSAGELDAAAGALQQARTDVLSGLADA